MPTYKNVYNVLKQFQDCGIIADGTYDINTKKPIRYQSGYQVSYVRPEAFEQLNEDDWDMITNYHARHLQTSADVGCYFPDGVEISFCIQNREIAEEMMEKYNQESMLDWSRAKGKEVDYFCLIMNNSYDKELRLNYDKILREIR